MELSESVKIVAEDLFSARVAWSAVLMAMSSVE